MAAPQPYARQQNFSTWQSNNPGQIYNGTDLDAEFNAVGSSLNATVAALNLIQRSDGALANQSVTKDALAASALALMATSGWLPRGPWVAGVSYAVRDSITQGTNAYVCVTAHVAGTFVTDLAASKWMIFPLSLSQSVLSALAATSTTSLAIGLGSATFTIPSGEAFFVGEFVSATSAANSANYMHGIVTSYSGTSLIVNILDTGGSGTHADWNISVSGTQGSIGVTGPAGPIGPVGTSPVQGRPTLVSGAPVMATSQTGKTVIYFTPYRGNNIILAGSTSVFTEVSVTLDATDVSSGSLYDLFMYNNAGTIVLGYGPAWTNGTTRSAVIALVSGVWVNNATITLRLSPSTNVSVGANGATYVGTFYATANGQTGMALTASSAGGGNNILGLYSAYNHVPIKAQNVDNTASWAYASGTWRPLDGASANINNRFSWVDGLQQSTARMQTQASFICGTNGSGFIGHNLDAITGAPINTVQAETQNFHTPINVEFLAQPQIGFHFMQAMEVIATSSGTFSGAISNFEVMA